MALLVLLFLQVLVASVGVSQGQDLVVPGVMIFGDSIVDVGNNNHRFTLVKANFPPYGRDFEQHKATGRFCNGKLAIDFIIDALGFTSYPPPYLSEAASGNNLLQGANFASAASGYLESTALLYQAVSLTKQLKNYKEYQSKVKSITSSAQATDLFTRSIFVLSAGSSDYLQNYYINPILRILYPPDRFSDLLLQHLTKFVQDLYDSGARRIGVMSLPPMGCIPEAITLYGGAGGILGNRSCVGRINDDAAAFNTKLNAAAEGLKKTHADLKLVVLDIYSPLLDLVRNPQGSGFTEVHRGCCGTGTIETGLLCNALSLGTCSNANEFAFWDSFHPSEAANKALADALLAQGSDLIS